MSSSNSPTPLGYKALLFAPALVYLLITACWRHRNADPLTGDETFYLFVSESLVDDYDVNVKNNLQKFGFRSAHLQESQSIAGPHGWFSVHNLGLSALLAVPWAVRGAWGARLTMALCCGLAAPVLYRTINRVWNCPRNSLLFTTALAFGLPFLQACNQIYPDLLAGILLLFAAEQALAANPVASPIRWRDLLLPTAVAFLPWLHIKYVAPALIVLAWHVDATRGRCCLTLAAALVASLALLACYNTYAFGKMSGPYTHDGLALHRNSLIVLLGLHFDQAQGMFLQQPLWLWGVVGLGPMWQRCRRACLWWLLLYAATIVPNAMHPNWYGGYSYLGRFGATGVLLWAIPLAYGARQLFADGKWTPATLASLAIALQSWLALHWLGADGLQFGCLFPEDVFSCHSMYPDSLKPYLPYWLPDSDVWRYPANFAALAVAGATLLFGAAISLFAGKRRAENAFRIAARVSGTN